MKYSFEYYDCFHDWFCSENADAWAWGSFWDAERSGEIVILHIEGTTDDWETSFEVYDRQTPYYN